jgi:enoyl-CoA hydratase
VTDNTENVVVVEQRDRILIITINRPEAKNAVNAAVSRGLADAVDRLDGDPGLSVGIVTGAGGSFCAGMDLKAFARGENVVVEGRGMGFTERPPVKPLIAAVEGYGLAGGMELALACDLIVASKDGAFGIPEVKRGLVAGGGGLLRLPQRIPPAIAMELALTGDQLPAMRAQELGLVNVLAEPGKVLMRRSGKKITANGPLAVAATKRMLVVARLGRRCRQNKPVWRRSSCRTTPKEGHRVCGEAAAEVDGHIKLAQWTPSAMAKRRNGLRWVVDRCQR